MPDRAGDAQWPGVVSVKSCSGTLNGHGVSPSCFVLTCNPQNGLPAMFGALVIGDGVNAVTIQDCKVSQIRSSGDKDSGFTHVLEIIDVQ